MYVYACPGIVQVFFIFYYYVLSIENLITDGGVIGSGLLVRMVYDDDTRHQ